ncbi:DUF4352 domain-containing protein [Nocardia sp. NPDC003482]
MTEPQYPAQNGPQYPPPPYQQQYPVPPKQRKRRVWPWIVLALIVLMFGGCFALLGGAVHEASKVEDKRTTAAPVGSEVRDGKFAFRVTGIDPAVATVGDNPYLRKQAQGEYVLVHVDVTNVGDAAQSYFGDNQKLIDDQGKSYTNDTAAEMNVNRDITAEINPGNKLSVTIVFDLPRGTVPAAVEFHDSAFSGGARVALK